VVRVEGNVLLDFGLVYTLQNGQSVPNAGDSHLFQFLVFERNQCFADDFVLYNE
jgi:hypothetical protein